ncbi:hypothetical protein O6H91_04G064200 [Diphasiastrum complanatum]|uniref:Uncharacterized protein n=1 Tax=Diphasiastrum complanatum TaxID=34168 RepID=A0ACC2DXQ4_DIPCM|nr:hypothetical protein O6H91_04G064200 [Diphasiastrum complanatum]
MSSMPRMLITASAAAPQALQTFVQPKYLVGEVLGSWNYDMGTTSCSGGRSAFVNSALKCFAVSSKICVVARSVNAGQRVMNERGSCGCLVCGRRKFFGFVGGGFFAELAFPSYAVQNGDEEYMKILERMHPQRPDWYEEIYAQSMLLGMQSYEAERCKEC